MSDFNLDSSDSGYRPVTVTYKGAEYTLGASTLGLLRIPGVLGLEGGEKATLTGEMILEKLPAALKVLGPELHEAITADPEPLGVDVELALVRAVTEVLNRFGRFQSTPEA